MSKVSFPLLSFPKIPSITSSQASQNTHLLPSGPDFGDPYFVLSPSPASIEQGLFTGQAQSHEVQPDYAFLEVDT